MCCAHLMINRCLESAIRGSRVTAAGIDDKCVCHARETCVLRLSARDAFANPRTSGGDSVAILLQGPLTSVHQESRGPEGETLPVVLHDLHNGAYVLTFLASAVGRYKLSVSVNGKGVRGGARVVYIQGGFDFSPSTLLSPDPSRLAPAPAHSYPLPNNSFALFGDAHLGQGNLLLLLAAEPPRAHGAGAAWFRRPQHVLQGFVTDFELSIEPVTHSCKAWRDWQDVHGREQGSEWCQARAGDGVALVLSKGGGDLPGVGEAGSGMGYQGIRGSLALEFDTRENYEHGDVSSNHISWQSSGPGLPNSASHAASLSHTSLIPLLADGYGHRVRVRYDPKLDIEHVQDPTFDFNSRASAAKLLAWGGGWVGGWVEGSGGDNDEVWGPSPGVMTVWIDDLSRPVLVSPINLPALLALSPDDRVFLGLTSSAGEAYARVEIKSWSMTDSSCPSDCNERGDLP
jgi:hypothetical protein